jgi:hypothetical protein
VAVSVMEIRIVCMPMNESIVSVPMRVGLARRMSWPMLVLMVVVVEMAMLMIQRLVDVLVLMPFTEVKIDAGRHQQRGRDERGSYLFV